MIHFDMSISLYIYNNYIYISYEICYVIQKSIITNHPIIVNHLRFVQPYSVGMWCQAAPQAAQAQEVPMQQ